MIGDYPVEWIELFARRWSVRQDTARMALDLWARMRAEGVTVKVTEGDRSAAAQNAILARGDGATRLRGGCSAHQHGAALHVSTTPSSALNRAGEAWEALGGRWGGRWRSPYDPHHFELPTRLWLPAECR